MGSVKKEEVRSALNDMSREALADALALLLSQGTAPEQTAAGMDKPELANFAQALQYLKRNYDFEELDFFSTEADLVYVQAGGRRILLTDRMSAASVSSDEKAEAKPENSLGGLNSGGIAGKDAPRESPNQSEGRFSNLEI
jgi:hypothetical protein